MNTIRTTFLNRFSDFFNPGMYFINGMSLQLNNPTSPQDCLPYVVKSYGELPKLQTQYPSMSNYDTTHTDIDMLRKFVNPDKDLKSLVANEKDYATGNDFVHVLEIAEEVDDELEDLVTIDSESVFSRVEDIGESTQSEESEILLKV